MMSIGGRLRKAREQKGLSQRELARQAGIRYATISELENEKRSAMNTDTAKALARALGVGVDYLIGTWDESEGEPEAAALAVVGT